MGRRDPYQITGTGRRRGGAAGAIAHHSAGRFERANAALIGVKDIRRIIETATRAMLGEDVRAHYRTLDLEPSVEPLIRSAQGWQQDCIRCSKLYPSWQRVGLFFVFQLQLETGVPNNEADPQRVVGASGILHAGVHAVCGSRDVGKIRALPGAILAQLDELVVHTNEETAGYGCGERSEQFDVLGRYPSDRHTWTGNHVL